MNEIDSILDTKDNLLIQNKFSKLVKWIFFILFLSVVGVGSLFGFFVYIKNPPDNFPANTTIEVPLGATVRDVAVLLKENNLVRSELAFYFYFTFVEDPTSIKASVYTFSQPMTMIELANQLTQGNYAEGLLRLTHIEGETVDDVAKRADALLREFDADKFIEIAKPYEGKLFPETYMIPETYREQELLDLFLKTFSEKTNSLQADIATSSLSLEEIIILASILEREANSKESKKIVSGILQNRLAIGMPLQADATVEYILNKPLKELTPEDLKIDSPYNTYLNKGLPPTPICNPGLDAIEAVLHPQETEYMFYITGLDGNFYYAKDFDEHRKNVARYLR